MSLKELPAHVRGNVYLSWAGIALGGLGILGFFLSFNSVAGPEQIASDGEAIFPLFAYVSILAWVIGLALTWVGRRNIRIAVQKREQEMREATRVDLDD
ncbi:MAG: hypothetical protein JXE06_04170 [Coriobacteriia bacterium]|nr:hypothetical protein [Coriobacteriia bacterium]MBN2821774.1 hypothetical protein [Coriobacteriia bacterium]